MLARVFAPRLLFPISRNRFFRGGALKFYHASAKLNLPGYLNEAVQDYLAAKADAKGIEPSDLVNDLLKREIEIIEAVRLNPE